MKPRLFVIPAFALLFALTMNLDLSAKQTRDASEHFFNETFGDYQEELQTAKEEGKKAIMIFFEMDDCPFCKRMKTTVLNQPEVQDYYREHFKLFTHDIEGDVEITNFKGEQVTQKDFAFKEHRVRATPVIAFFNLQGEKIMKYTGATSGSEEFLWIGEYIADGHYENTPFTKYKRERRKAAREQ